MRRWVSALLLVAALFGAADCKRRSKKQRAAPPHNPGEVASIISMGDPSYAGQLVRGFYEIENGAWRWTQKDFTVVLATPAGAAQKGALLVLQLTVAEASIAKLGAITLTGSVNGFALPPQQYNAPGNFTYRRDIPAGNLEPPNVHAEFHLDKALEPGQVEPRQLGAVVREIGLEAK